MLKLKYYTNTFNTINTTTTNTTNTNTILNIMKTFTTTTITTNTTTTTNNNNNNNYVRVEMMGRNGGRVIVLDREKSLNALNLEMINSISSNLNNFLQQLNTQFIMITGKGRAFCAGGDIKEISSNEKCGKLFFKEEYKLNYRISTFDKPIIALLDGITMGGGVGISVHAPIRIATENTLFAMPETAIGLFPDVGGSFFLPRLLDGNVGTFMGLTGARLKGQQVYWAGLATHYVPSNRLQDLHDRLSSLLLPSHNSNSNSNSLGYDLNVLSGIIDEFSGNVSIQDYHLSHQPVHSVINTCFGASSVEEILQLLEENGSEFALDTRNTLLKMSPTSLKITLLQLQKGAKLDIKSCFNMEYRISSHIISTLFSSSNTPSSSSVNLNLKNISMDFREGVRALLVDKTGDPKWNPSSIYDVSNDDVQWYFSPLANVGDEELELGDVGGKSFLEYPYMFGLPSDKEVLKALSNGKLLLTRDELKRKLVAGKGGVGGSLRGLKPGFDEKLDFLLKSSNFTEDKNGKLTKNSKI